MPTTDKTTETQPRVQFKRPAETNSAPMNQT
jgi:hypothetical protein